MRILLLLQEKNNYFYYTLLACMIVGLFINFRKSVLGGRMNRKLQKYCSLITKVNYIPVFDRHYII